jgi:hypothetical protein
LRAQTFFSLTECNHAITLVMQRMNDRTMRHLGLSRRELFEKVERAALNGLPAEDWEFAEWRRARVNLDYHIEVHDFLYSVPHALIRAEVEVRVTERIVEVFHRGQRVAVHQRRYMGRKHGTDPDHMPSTHRFLADWTPDRFRRWAGKIGPNTEALISAVLASRKHPEQGFRTCLGILRSYRGRRPRDEQASAETRPAAAANPAGSSQGFGVLDRQILDLYFAGVDKKSALITVAIDVIVRADDRKGVARRRAVALTQIDRFPSAGQQKRIVAGQAGSQVDRVRRVGRGFRFVINRHDSRVEHRFVVYVIAIYQDRHNKSSIAAT